MSIEKKSTKLSDTDYNIDKPTELDLINEAKHTNSGDSDDDSSSSSSESSETESLDGGWGWMVVLASFVAHVISDGCCYSAGVLLVEWLDVFEESKAKTSWIPALFVSMHAIFGPISSICTNKFGCRKTTIAGGAIACLGCVLSVFANSVDQLCFTFGIVSGFGLSLVYVPAVIVVAYYFEKKRAFATGIAVAGSGIGGFLFPLLVEFLVETYSWRGAVLIMGGIMLNIILCGALFRPLVSFKEQRKRQKYLRSLEKFSRVSSQHQSWENIEQNGVCDHQYGEEKECVFCQQNQCDTPPMSRSLQQIPTYLDIESIFGEIPKITSNTSPKHNSSSMINFSTDRSSNVARVSKDEEIVETLPKKILKKALKTKSKTGEKKEKKKAHFPDHIVPKYPKDIFYKGSLWKAGFLLGKGQSASCPDIFVRSKRKNKTIHEKFKGFGLALKYMMDFTIFRSPVFMCFCFHSMLLYVSYDIPYMYLPDLAKDLHISTTRASLLLSIAGIASTVGQIIIGFIGDRPQVNSRYLYVLMISIAGLSTLFVPIIHDYLLFISYCLVFGFTISANYCLTTVIVVDLLGMEKLTNAYGFVTLSEGIANLIGVPLGGWITDTTGNYDLAFYLSGIGVIISAMVLLLMPCLMKCDPLVKKEYDDNDDDDDDDQKDSSSSSDHLEINGFNTAI